MMLRAASILALMLLSGAPTLASAQGSVTAKAGVRQAATKPAASKPASTVASPKPEAEAFSRWIEDLPVMPGLTETDGGYSFEIAQGGRLAEARLHGVVTEEVVRSFYASALPPLGWTAEASQPFLYHRGRERLIFHVSPAKPLGVLAVFVLSPRAGGPAAAAPPPS